MSIEGTANTEYASLSGKIHTLVIDKTLSISGAAADAKAVGKEIERLDDVVTEAKEAYEEAKTAYDEAVGGMEEAARTVAIEVSKEEVSKLTATDVGAYEKEEVLSDETKFLYGLDTLATPDDAFAFLGKYNTHWWSSFSEGESGFNEKRTLRTQDTAMNKVNQSSPVIQYANAISIDATGNVTLVNPSSLTLNISSIQKSQLDTLNGCYMTGLAGNTTAVYYVPYKEETATKIDWRTEYYGPFRMYYADDVGVFTDLYLQANYHYYVTSELYTILPGETVYFNSTDRNAYPDGAVDGVVYKYLGVPFENIIAAPKCEIGTYVGTGIRFVLGFGITPSYVFIMQGSPTTYETVCGFYMAGAEKMIIINDTYVLVGTTLDGNTLEVPATLSTSGKTYHYLVLE